MDTQMMIGLIGAAAIIAAPIVADMVLSKKKADKIERDIGALHDATGTKRTGADLSRQHEDIQKKVDSLSERAEKADERYRQLPEDAKHIKENIDNLKRFSEDYAKLEAQIVELERDVKLNRDMVSRERSENAGLLAENRRLQGEISGLRRNAYSRAEGPAAHGPDAGITGDKDNKRGGRER